MDLKTASLTIDLKTATNDQSTGQESQWVQLLPPGQFAARDGRGPWKVENAAAIIENTRQYAGKNSLPVDYEHQIDLAPKNGQPAPAAGWIVGLKTDEQGIWGLVNWTDKAIAYLKAKEYKYLSPVFSYSKDGGIVRILRAALTNNPALEMTALAKADDSTETAESGSELNEIKVLLGLTEDTGKEVLIEKLKTLKAQAGNDGFVALGEFQRVESELGGIKEKIAKAKEEKALAKVEDAIQHRIFPESLKEWGVSMCRFDEDGFDEFLNRFGAILKIALTMQTSRLTAEEKAFLDAPANQNPNPEILSRLGLSEDDINRYGDKPA